MESFIRQQNILHYRHLLTNVTDETERQTILKLLADEEQKRQDDDVCDYQQYAKECLRWADEADSEQHCELFLGMARAWTQADLILKGVMVAKAKDEFESVPQLQDDF
jgi:hypothetical protein